MDIIAGFGTGFACLGTAFALRSYFKTLKDYLDPTIIKTKRRIQNRYFEYDMNQDGDLLLWKDLLKNEFHNPTKKLLEESFRPIRIGDMVELDNANITRWVPFFPGKKYSKEGEMIIDKHLSRISEKS